MLLAPLDFGSFDHGTSNSKNEGQGPTASAQAETVVEAP
jgi:hypothetical protein